MSREPVLCNHACGTLEHSRILYTWVTIYIRYVLVVLSQCVCNVRITFESLVNVGLSAHPRAESRHDYIGVVGRMSEPGTGGREATVSGGGVIEAPTSGGSAGVTRPLVLPETYDGTGSSLVPRLSLLRVCAQYDL